MNYLKVAAVVIGLSFASANASTGDFKIICGASGVLVKNDNYKRKGTQKDLAVFVISNNDVVTDIYGNTYRKDVPPEGMEDSDSEFIAISDDNLHTFTYYKSPETDDLEVAVMTNSLNSDDFARPSRVKYYQQCVIN